MDLPHWVWKAYDRWPLDEEEMVEVAVSYVSGAIAARIGGDLLHRAWLHAAEVRGKGLAGKIDARLARQFYGGDRMAYAMKYSRPDRARLARQVIASPSAVRDAFKMRSIMTATRAGPSLAKGASRALRVLGRFFLWALVAELVIYSAPHYARASEEAHLQLHAKMYQLGAKLSD